MSRDELLEKVQTILAEILDLDPEEIDEDKSFVEDLSISSLEVMEFLGLLEEELGVTIIEEQTQNIIYVRDVLDLLEEEL